MSHIVENSHSRLGYSPEGGQILSWTTQVNGIPTELLYQGSSSKRTGIPILFPFANPLENNIFEISGKEIGQHGFGRNSLWHVSKLSSDIISMKLTNTDISTEMQQAYPFAFEVILLADISRPGTLVYTLEVINKEEHAYLPIAPGIHPYFPVNHEQKAELTIKEIPSFNAREISWDSKTDGTFYAFPGDVGIAFPSGITLKMRETSPYPDIHHLVVWSQTKDEQDSNFVCFEPFTRGTNAINDNPIVIKPDQSWEMSVEFSITQNG